MAARIDISYQVPSRLVAAMAHAPGVLERHLDRGVGRAAHELARDMRRRAPKASSNLVNSIRVVDVGSATRVVGPGQEYGRMVEEGTGPGGVPAEGTSPEQKDRSLIAWINVKRITPRDPRMTVADLAYAIARSIAHRGTPARPFVAPAAEQMQGRFPGILRRALADGLREARLA